MDFSDDRWVGLCGGYKAPYDPRGALRALETEGGIKDAWTELWTELHHQGDIGEASYAALPAIARFAALCQTEDWNPYALAAVIEQARQDVRNPPLPPWLVDGYQNAWTQLFQTALAKLPLAEDESLINSLMAVLAAHKGQPMLARMAILSEGERKDMLDEVGWA